MTGATDRASGDAGDTARVSGAEDRAGDNPAAPVDPRDAAAPEGEPLQEAARARGGKLGRPVLIELEISRQRAIGWTIFGLILGGLLIRGLGTVGVWVGIALVVTGVYHAWQLIRTLLYPPGTIEVSEHEVSLPRGLCVPRPVVAAPRDITAIYFLRRSVPWNRTAPVLIIELGTKAMAFPRDWFASEADQRHVIHAVQRAKGESPQAGDTA
jgi:hypothetical protein